MAGLHKPLLTIVLAFEPSSCQPLYALRERFHQTPSFLVSIIRSIKDTESNDAMLSQVLPRVAAQQAPFEIGLSKLFMTKGVTMPAVKYRLAAPTLWTLRDKLRDQLPEIRILNANKNTTERWRYIPLEEHYKLQPERYQKEFTIPVRSRIQQETDANKILDEVSKIDSKSLGRLKAIGLQVCDERSKDEAVLGPVFTFLGKPPPSPSLHKSSRTSSISSRR